MKLNKKLVTMLTTCLSLLGLVGCKSYKAPEAVDYDGSKVTVQWWTNYQDPYADKTLNENSTEEQIAAAKKNSNYREYFYAQDVISAFNAEEKYKNIKIEMTYKGSYSDIAKAATEAIPNGGQPTMLNGYQDNIAVYNALADGVVFDSANYVTRDLESDSDFSQAYLNAEKNCYGGKFYSLPYSKSSETLAVNKSVFDATGAGAIGENLEKTTTEDKDGKKTTKIVRQYTAPIANDSKIAYSIPENIYDAMEIAEKMKTDFPNLFNNKKGDKTGIELINSLNREFATDNPPTAPTTDPEIAQRDSQGYFTAVPFCWDSAENMFITMMENSGAGYTNGSGKNLNEQLLWNSDKAKEVLIQLKKWNNEGLFATQNQLYITNVQKNYHAYSSDLLKYGRVFMCVSSTAGARYFASDAKYFAQLNHGLNYAKGSKAEDAKVISQGPSITFFTRKDPQENAAAFEFYKFLTKTENSAKLAVNTSYFPLRKSSDESEQIKAIKEAPAVTADSNYADKNKYYTKTAFDLNSTYSKNGNYFMSDVFDHSAASRTAVGNLVAEVLNATAPTDEAIKAVVDTAFKNAVDAVGKK